MRRFLALSVRLPGNRCDFAQQGQWHNQKFISKNKVEYFWFVFFVSQLDVALNMQRSESLVLVTSHQPNFFCNFLFYCWTKSVESCWMLWRLIVLLFLIVGPLTKMGHWVFIQLYLKGNGKGKGNFFYFLHKRPCECWHLNYFSKAMAFFL